MNTSFCKNCNTKLVGNYCYQCGQKRLERNDKSLKEFTKHFFGELFLWDSRFFRTIKFLFLKPGYLDVEYMSDRHVRYVSPARLYLFISLVVFFFLIRIDPDQYSGLTTENSQESVRSYLSESLKTKNLNEETFKEKFNAQINDKMTFILIFILILFSLVLKIIYMKKGIYFIEHVVFSLHFFSVVLLCFLVTLFMPEDDWVISFILIFILPVLYLFIAIRRVYHQKLLYSLFSSLPLGIYYFFLIWLWYYGSVVISCYFI